MITGCPAWGSAGWRPGRARAGCIAGSCPDDHFPQQESQGLIAVPQVPPSAVHGGEGGLDYFFCHGKLDHQESGQPGKGAVVRVVEHGNRLVSVPSGHGWRPGHPGAGRRRSGVTAGRAASGCRPPGIRGRAAVAACARDADGAPSAMAGCAAAGLSRCNGARTAGTRRVAVGPCTWLTGAYSRWAGGPRRMPMASWRDLLTRGPVCGRSFRIPHRPPRPAGEARWLPACGPRA